ncbi:MAG: Tfp pilus assembly protein FimT/FimU [Phycisphaeraceae bacterium]
MSARLRGLSLIELVMVFALVAVLMALSLPMLSHANAEARSVVCRQNLAEIGGAVNGHLRDYGMLPRLAELPPHEPGMSLPELVGPRLQTPNVTFCPSDETERSQVLGTSYRWATAFNALKATELDRALDQPILHDRETYHAGTEIGVNELMLKQHRGGLRFVVTGSPEEHAEEAATGHKPANPNKGKGNNNAGGNGKGNNDNEPNDQANPNARRGRD